MSESVSAEDLYVDPADSEIPPWSRLTAPVLQTMLDGEVRRRRDIISAARKISGVSESGMTETLNSGAFRLDGRLSWAVQHLSKARLIEAVSRGRYRITEAGRLWLQEHPEGMTYGEANTFFGPYWVKQSTSTDTAKSQSTEALSLQNSSEVMDTAEKANRHRVGAELLTALREADPEFFENVVVDVLLAMGYGGAHGKGAAIGRSHDGGIDGVIDEDALGLDKIYIQAKRYGEGNNVGQPEIQGFVGALHGQAAQKGVFFTTSAFTSSARSYAAAIPTHLVLIDGERLVDLMMHYRVGVQIQRTYVTLELDQDYFE
jgi:restriction system protein